KGSDGALVVPAGSVSVAVTEEATRASDVAAGQMSVQPMLASVVAVPATTPSMDTVMVLPGSAVPLKVGVVSLVASPLPLLRPGRSEERRVGKECGCWGGAEG